MNLAALADNICGKIGKTDDESVAKCKDYLRQRHEMIYDTTLWKDSLGVFDVEVEAEATVAVLPFESARPIACWDADSGIPVDITSLATIAMVNPAGLTAIGSLMQFVEVDSVGVPWQLDSDGENIAASCLPSAAGDIGVEVGLAGIVATADNRQISLTVALTASPQMFAASLRSVQRITKPITDDLVAITRLSDSSAFYLPAACTEASFARLQLVQPPGEAVSLKVLAKKKLRQMVLDTDGPMIRGIDNALLAFAMGDMLERSRQYAKAQVKTNEGTGLLTVARDLEIQQSAHQCCIVPQVAQEAGDGWN